MEINNLTTEPDHEKNPSGKTRLETGIDRLQKELIAEGLSEHAEGLWSLTPDGLKECIEIKNDF